MGYPMLTLIPHPCSPPSSGYAFCAGPPPGTDTCLALAPLQTHLPLLWTAFFPVPSLTSPQSQCLMEEAALLLHSEGLPKHLPSL